MTNSSNLQKKMDENEYLMKMPLTEYTLNDSYTKLTLGTTQKVHNGETKILGVKWNPSTDNLIFDFSNVASQEAETHWIKEMQSSLLSNPKFSAWQQQFGLFIDNWRCGGQLINADLLFMTQHPILLDSRVTTFIHSFDCS